MKVALAENRILADLYMVGDGIEALEFLRREGERYAAMPHPDLILLDLNMPRMDGRKLLEALKQDAKLRDIPVVVLTTSEVERDVVSSYQLGAAGYITKPVDITQFMDAIRQVADYWITLVRLPARD